MNYMVRRARIALRKARALPAPNEEAELALVIEETAKILKGRGYHPLEESDILDAIAREDEVRTKSAFH